jgi:hypothetical protein
MQGDDVFAALELGSFDAGGFSAELFEAVNMFIKPVFFVRKIDEIKR